MSSQSSVETLLREDELEYVPCDLCGQDDTTLLFYAKDTLVGTPGRYSVVRCRHCNLAYLNPRPTRQAVLKIYPADYFNELGGGAVTSSSVRKVLKNILYQLSGGIAGEIERLSPGRVLDVGCGDGRYLALFRDMGWEPYGIDPSALAIERARGRGLSNTVAGELPGAGLPEKHFDLIIMRYTIENMHNPSAVLQEARRLLKDEGKLFVSAPSISSPVARVFKQYCAYVEAPRHLHFFTPETLRALLQKNGFRVVEFARVIWLSLFRDVVNRLSGGRFRALLARKWVSRGMWLAGAPLGLLLGYGGLNRGNMEVIVEKDYNNTYGITRFS